MMGLTRRQLALLDYLKAYIEANRVAPSFDEIIKAMGWASKSNVCRVLDALEERGAIKHLKGRSRAITICESEPAIEIILRPQIKAEIAKLARKGGTTPRAVVNELLAEMLGIEDGGVTT